MPTWNDRVPRRQLGYFEYQYPGSSTLFGPQLDRITSARVRLSSSKSHSVFTGPMGIYLGGLLHPENYPKPYFPNEMYNVEGGIIGVSLHIYSRTMNGVHQDGLHVGLLTWDNKDTFQSLRIYKIDGGYKDLSPASQYLDNAFTVSLRWSWCTGLITVRLDSFANGTPDHEFVLGRCLNCSENSWPARTGMFVGEINEEDVTVTMTDFQCSAQPEATGFSNDTDIGSVLEPLCRERSGTSTCDTFDRTDLASSNDWKVDPTCSGSRRNYRDDATRGVSLSNGAVVPDATSNAHSGSVKPRCYILRSLRLPQSSNADYVVSMDLMIPTSASRHDPYEASIVLGSFGKGLVFSFLWGKQRQVSVSARNRILFDFTSHRDVISVDLKDKSQPSEYQTRMTMTVKLERSTGNMTVKLTRFGSHHPDEEYSLGICRNCFELLDPVAGFRLFGGSAGDTFSDSRIRMDNFGQCRTCILRCALHFSSFSHTFFVLFCFRTSRTTEWIKHPNCLSS